MGNYNKGDHTGNGHAYCDLKSSNLVPLFCLNGSDLVVVLLLSSTVMAVGTG